MPHKMYIHMDAEIDQEYHRQLKTPSKRAVIDKVEQAILEAVQEANPEEVINPMDVKVLMPNHAVQG